MITMIKIEGLVPYERPVACHVKHVSRGAMLSKDCGIETLSYQAVGIHINTNHNDEPFDEE